MDRGLLKRKWRRSQAPCGKPQTLQQVVLPRKFQEEVTRMAHEEIVVHMGAKKTGETILSDFYWPKMDRLVRDYIKRYHNCQLCKD